MSPINMYRNAFLMSESDFKILKHEFSVNIWTECTILNSNLVRTLLNLVRIIEFSAHIWIRFSEYISNVSISPPSPHEGLFSSIFKGSLPYKKNGKIWKFSIFTF